MKKQSPHVILYSHGFGVDKTDRGLFTDIAAAVPDAESIVFNYNGVDAATGAYIVKPLSEQALMLQRQFMAARAEYPDAAIDLVCHSQGCVVAAIARIMGIRRTIFIAPLYELNKNRTIERTSKYPNTHINLNGMSQLGRSDGSITFVPAAYWQDAQNVKPMALYSALTTVTQLTIYKAGADTVLGDTDLSSLSNIAMVETLPGNHDFAVPNRALLLDKIKQVIYG